MDVIFKKRLRQLAVVVLLATILPYVSFPFMPHFLFVVATDSMSPTINHGDIVVISDSPVENRSIVVFRNPINEGYEVHRICGTQRVGNHAYYVTKGDAVNQTDSFLIPQENVVGVVSAIVPYIGLYYLIPRLHALLITMSLIVLYVTIALYETRRWSPGKEPEDKILRNRKRPSLNGQKRPTTKKIGTVALALFLISVLVQPPLMLAGINLVYPESQHPATVTTSKIAFQNGIAGSSTIGDGGNSATVSIVAPAPVPTYYPSGYNILTGTYVSGVVPASVQTVDSNYLIIKSSISSYSNQWVTPSSVYNKCGEYFFYPATKTIDGNTGSQWQCWNDHLHWIEYDMGEAKNITKVRIYGGSYAINGIDVYVSNDPASWGSSVVTNWNMPTGSQWRESPAFNKIGRYIRLADMDSQYSILGWIYNNFYEFQAYVSQTEYKVSTEFLFSSMTNNTPAQLNFTVVSEYDIASVSVTIQVWNSSAYATSGQGYLTYTSSGSNETKLLSINMNPQFYASNGNAKIKITGVKTTTTQYQQKVNQVKLVYSYSSSSNYDYVLKVVNQVTYSWKVNLKVYDSSNIGRLSSATISLHDGTTSDQIIVSGGVIPQSEGTPYDLAGSATIFISMNNLQATTSETSNLYVYLKAEILNSGVHVQLQITFQIT